MWVAELSRPRFIMALMSKDGDICQNDTDWHTKTDSAGVRACEPLNYTTMHYHHYVKGQKNWSETSKYLKTVLLILYNHLCGQKAIKLKREQRLSLHLSCSYSRFPLMGCTIITLTCFVFSFFVPPGCLSSSPTSPEAVLFESKLYGTPLSIMRSAHQAHVERFPKHCWDCIERDNMK